MIEQTDQFILRKAACRAALAQVVNQMLTQWRQLPEPEAEALQHALIAVLADLTAEVTLGLKVVSRGQFLAFMGRSYDVTVKRSAESPE